LGEATLQNLHERFSCTGFRRVVAPELVPTTVVTAALAGGLVAQLVVDAIHHRVASGSRRWTMLLPQARWMADTLTVGTQCPFHGRPRNRVDVQLAHGPDVSWSAIVNELGVGSSATLLLRHELVTGFKCSKCTGVVSAIGPKGRMAQEHSICSRCQIVMAYDSVSRIEPADPLAERSLAELGYASGDFLSVMVSRRKMVIALAPVPGWSRDARRAGGAT
jgi:hypothetical protein